MTNSFFIAVLVLWSTNTMDVLLTPSGDNLLRSTITSQTHIYTVPGQTTVTNTVAVSTNSVHLRMQWVVVDEFPPVPPHISTFGTNANVSARKQ